MTDELTETGGVSGVLRGLLCATLAVLFNRSGLLGKGITVIKRWLGFSGGAPGAGGSGSPASQGGASLAESSALVAGSRRAQDNQSVAQGQAVDRKALLAMHNLSEIGSVISMANTGAGTSRDGRTANQTLPRALSREVRL
jgi:hypothetical protein